MSLDSLVEDVGPIGRFQLLLIAGVHAPAMMCVMSMMFMVFGAFEPDWSCFSRDLNVANESQGFEVTSFMTLTSDVFEFEKGGSFSNSTFSNSSGSEGSEGSVSKQCLGVDSGDGPCDVIVFSPGVSTIVTEFRLVCDKAWVVSLTISLQMIGVLIGAAVAGQLGDSIGRKKTLFLFTALHAAFCFISTCSVSWQMFAALRLLIGTTIGGLLVTTFPYCTEFLGVKYRTLVATVPFWAISSVSFSLMCWAMPHWLYLHVVIGALSAACLPICFVMPESVRWLTVKGRVTEAHSVLCSMARCNGRQPPSLADVSALCALRSPEKSAKKYSYLDIFSKPRIALISVLSGWMWFSASLAYFGISFGIMNLSGDFHFNFFLMSVTETPAALFVYFSAKIGRRWLCFLAFFVVSASLFAVVPINMTLPEDRAGVYVNVMCNVARFCIGTGWGTMMTLHAELYPTVVRSIGVGYLNTIARIGGILAPYVLSVKEPNIFYCILGGAMALTTITPLFLPETRDLPLQDIFEETREESLVKGNNQASEMSDMMA